GIRTYAIVPRAAETTSLAFAFLPPASASLGSIQQSRRARLGHPPTERRLGRDRHVRELELGAAARAHGVVQLDDLSAPRTLAAELLGVPAIEDRGQQAEERDQTRDQEPDEERAAFDLAH